jgi:hypothetical protein
MRIKILLVLLNIFFSCSIILPTEQPAHKKETVMIRYLGGFWVEAIAIYKDPNNNHKDEYCQKDLYVSSSGEAIRNFHIYFNADSNAFAQIDVRYIPTAEYRNSFGNAPAKEASKQFTNDEIEKLKSGKGEIIIEDLIKSSDEGPEPVINVMDLKIPQAPPAPRVDCSNFTQKTRSPEANHKIVSQKKDTWKLTLAIGALLFVGYKLYKNKLFKRK